MPKAKSLSKKTSTTRKIKATSPKPKLVKQEKISEEYAEYLERYASAGKGRPKLSSSEFDRLDDELLDLLGQEMEHGLDDEQFIRVKELEYLLLESEQ